MKKYLVMILVVIMSIIMNEKTTSKQVFNEIKKDEYAYEYFYLKSKDGLNSKTLNKIINKEEIELIAIYPNTDKIIDKKLKEKLEYYSCSPIINTKDNINRFINNYIQNLKNKNYLEEADKIYYEGIKINKILIYASYNSVYNIIKDNKNITYQVSEI